MQSFDELKNLWQAADARVPDVEAIRAAARRSHRAMLWRNVAGAVLLAGTFAFILFIALHYHFEHISTNTGIVITLIAIIGGIVFNSKLALMLMKQSSLSLDNAAYLAQLVRFRTTQRRIQSAGLSAYFILLTLGIALYMGEFALRSWLFGLISYSLVLAWMAFNWFYIRRRAIAKQEKAINAQIENIEKLMRGLEE